MHGPRAPDSAPLCAPSDEDLRALLLIRHFEWMLLRLFSEGKVHGTTHTCLGQEYVPVALRPLLEEHDFELSNHRGHGHYLARFDDVEGLLAEIMGRRGGIARGVGGSQHLYREGRFLSTGIQGEGACLGVGVALHLRRRHPGRLAVVHVGDGTFGEGAVYEALNMAALWSLPLLVVVENNRISQSTPVELQMAGDVGGRARAFGIDHLAIDDVDPGRIRARVAPRIRAMRGDPRPHVLEFRTFRLGPHSKGDDTRDEADLEAIRAWDWYPRYRALDPARFERVERQIRRRLEHALQDVDGRAPGDWPVEAGGPP